MLKVNLSHSHERNNRVYYQLLHNHNSLVLTTVMLTHGVSALHTYPTGMSLRLRIIRDLLAL